jgi:hypothetical protein
MTDRRLQLWPAEHFTVIGSAEISSLTVVAIAVADTNIVRRPKWKARYDE